MIEEQSLKDSIKKQFTTTVQGIRSQYQARIEELTTQIQDYEIRTKMLEEELKDKTVQIKNVENENANLKAENEKLAVTVAYLERSKETAQNRMRMQIAEKEENLKQLSLQMKKMQKQLRGYQNQDSMSLDQSSVYLQDYSNSSFAVQISELFKNSPRQIMKFLEAFEGDKVIDQKQAGPMECMFVSIDGLSVQKFVGVNRTFLKRKIKQHYRRFRFVIIYRPETS